MNRAGTCYTPITMTKRIEVSEGDYIEDQREERSREETVLWSEAKRFTVLLLIGEDGTQQLLERTITDFHDDDHFAETVRTHEKAMRICGGPLPAGRYLLQDLTYQEAVEAGYIARVEGMDMDQEPSTR
jgi:hypothetical protein